MPKRQKTPSVFQTLGVFFILQRRPAGSPLLDEERQRDDGGDQQSGQDANAPEVAHDVRVIGVDGFTAARGSRDAGDGFG